MKRWGRSLVVVLAFAAQVAAASPSAELSTYLAPAPGSDWLARADDPSVLNGPFNAHDYTVDVNDTGGSERALNRYGFVAGYGRTWLQRVTQDYLVERVFEFNANQGAIRWFNDMKLFNGTSDEYKRDIPALESSQVLSFGVELDTPGNREYRIEFVKGNFFHVIHMGSYKNDLAAAAQVQAQKQFDTAPDVTSQQLTSSTPIDSRVLVLGAIAGVVVILAVALAVVLLVVLASRRRSTPVPASVGGVQMSPDGAYWWDGARWRYAVTDPPPPTPSP